jgi:zinc transport system substrate-binding protein
VAPRRASALTGLVLAAAVSAAALAGCGTSEPSGSGPVRVVTAFYPLQFAVERVGGDRVDATNLTKPGAEPHDLELAPQDVAKVAEADLVVYLSGFQPAVDEAVAQAAGDRALDVSDAAALTLRAPDGSGTPDPHFWLDPTRLADVGDTVAAELTAADPAGEATYAANAADLRADLEALDADLSNGLAVCDSRYLVTSHTAFGYLADRYRLEQVGIVGISPEGEPSPGDLARVASFVEDHGVTTVFYETLVSPDVAETVARETGATTAVLDPLEGLAAGDSRADYLTVMHDNLATLRTGLGCR